VKRNSLKRRVRSWGVGNRLRTIEKNKCVIRECDGFWPDINIAHLGNTKKQKSYSMDDTTSILSTLRGVYGVTEFREEERFQMGENVFDKVRKYPRTLACN